MQMFATRLSSMSANQLSEELNTILQEVVECSVFSRGRGFYPITVDTLMIWIAIWLEMGITSKSNIKSYWEKEHQVEDISKWLGRDRWEAIWRSLWHLSDGLFFVLEEFLQDTFRNHWTPFQEVCIDETVRLFKGWSKNKVYSPDKPTKRGLKYYTSADSAHFIYWFHFHRSREFQGETEVTRNLCGEGFSKLPSGLGPYKCYVDNYYGGEQLANDLLKMGHYFTLGCRKNRPTYLFQN